MGMIHVGDGLSVHQVLAAELADGIGLVDLGRARIQHPGLGLVRGRHVKERRLLQEIDVERLMVAGSEGIAHHLVEQVRRGTIDGGQLFALDAQLRQRAQQRPGVGMPCIEENLVDHADFHNLAGVHNRHTVGHVGHHAQVVGDIDDGHVLLALQLADQIQNLRLDGHIQGGGRLVADQDLRTAGHGDGDDHALAHAAGKLMRILIIAALRIGDTHQLQHVDGLALGLAAAHALMQLDGLLNLHADLLQRVQAGHGILRHHGDLAAADGAPFLLGSKLGQILAVIQDGAAGDRAVFIQHAHKALGKHGLARAGLAHDGQRFAVIQFQGALADGVQLFAAQGELHLQILGSQNRLGAQDLLGALLKIDAVFFNDLFAHLVPSPYTWLRGSHASENALPTR